MSQVFRLAALGVLVIAGTAAAPGTERPHATGSISGRIVDAAKDPIPRATVTARAYTRGPVKEMLSHADGTYEFTGLPDGLYWIDATIVGFDIARRNRVDVRVGAVQGADLVLDVSAICECIGGTWPGAPVTLQGVIADGRGDPLPHVRLTLSEGGSDVNGYADAAGRFRARVPENRVYVLTTASPGFVTQRTTIRVREAARGTMTVPIGLLAEELAEDLPPLERLRQPCCTGGVFIDSRR